MAFNTGAGTKLAIGKESAWGTPVADTMLVNYTSESLSPEVTKTEEENLLAAMAASAYDLMGLRVSGDISAILKPENAGYFMQAALGGTDVVAAVSATQQHTIPPVAADGDLPSYTIFVDRKQAVKKYSGCRVNSLKLSAKAGDYVRATLSFKGKDEATGVIASSTVPSLKAYKFINATVIAGGMTFEATSFEFSHENNLEDGPQTSSSGLYATEPVHTKRKTTITIETPYDANAETVKTTNLLADTVISSIVIHLESPSIITAALKYRMDITLNNVAIMEVKTNVGGPGMLTTSIAGEATAVGATLPVSAVIYDNNAVAY
ncbi:MAG: phage tail tube protein [Clostridia bacterium]